MYSLSLTLRSCLLYFLRGYSHLLKYSGVVVTMPDSTKNLILCFTSVFVFCFYVHCGLIFFEFWFGTILPHPRYGIFWIIGISVVVFEILGKIFGNPGNSHIFGFY